MAGQSIQGDNAIGVQVLGASNQVLVLAGGSRLLLDQWHLEREAVPATERDLLLTNRRATTLVGRAAELETLDSWRRSDARIAVRCMTGRAGSGKTRLGIEACERAAAEGWVAGFVSGRELQRFDAAQNLGNWRSPEPTLIVVDEAAASMRILKAWLDALARRAPVQKEPPLRLLLLERHAEAEFGWWAELKRSDTLSAASAGDIIGAEQPVALTPIAAADDRRALLAESMRLAARIMGKPPIEPPLPGADAEFDRLLDDDLRAENEPLFLIMAGLVAVERGAPEALALAKPELGQRVAESERGRLTRLGAAQGLDGEGRLLGHLAACLTLQRGARFEEAARLVAEETEATGLPSPLGTEAIVEILAEALPTPAGDKIGSVKPDLIGSAFLLAEITGPRTRAEEARQATVARCHNRAGNKVVEALVLAAQDYAEGRSDHASVRWLRALVDTMDDSNGLREVALALPERSQALSGLARDVAGRQLELLDAEEGGVADPELRFERDSRRADLLRMLAFQMRESGDAVGAAEIGQRGVAVESELAERDPRFRERLALSLDNLSLNLRDLGRPEEALAAARRAVAFQEQLAQERGAVSPQYAGALGNLARRLAENGGADGDVLAMVMAARQMWWELDALNPGLFDTDLATVENSFAILGSQYFSDEALVAARNSEAIFRRLAARQPDSFAPYHVKALETLANRLGEAGQVAEALRIRQEIVDQWSRLERNSPESSAFHVAASHVNLAASLIAAERWEEALAAVDRGVQRFEQLARSVPGRAARPHAQALMNRAAALERLNRGSEAVASARQAVAALAAEFLTRPAAHLRAMADLIRDYVRLSKRCGIAYDEELVRPLWGRIDEMGEAE